MSALPRSETPDRFCIAILALGGQGGGVLADWIQHVARGQGWLAQGTSVPGVAQRTGSTVYYVELGRMQGDRTPVMAQMPVPGDVDIVVASELMEAGRAMLRGFSTADRTTLIGSTHRIYAISEKSAMGDGRGNSDNIIEAAGRRAKRFIGFDMDAATERSGSVISAVMFGALAGSGALPFARQDFEEAITASGIAVTSNLKGFDEGFRHARGSVALPTEAVHHLPVPTTAAGRALQQRILDGLPEPAWHHALHGAKRLIDYQDTLYAETYLDQLERIAARDRAPWVLTSEAARHLALWMSYEDAIRVADLKTRESRMARVKSEVRAKDDQLLSVTEFMHPRLREVCEILPAGIARAILASPRLSRILEPMFREGRFVETTSLKWFLVLRMLAGMRRIRRQSLRFQEEHARIGAWLARVEATAPIDNAHAVELVRCQRLIKGYGDTFERGLGNFQRIMNHLATVPCDSSLVRQLRDAALQDDKATELDAAIAR